jgi:hypothetical protein
MKGLCQDIYVQFVVPEMYYVGDITSRFIILLGARKHRWNPETPDSGHKPKFSHGIVLLPADVNETKSETTYFEKC